MSKINIAKVQSKDPLYNEADSYQYQTAINSWVALWEDVYPLGAPQLIEMLEAHGLAETIQRYDEIASMIINSLDHNTVISSMIDKVGIGSTLLLYRYLKRYTWHAMPSLVKEMRTQFLSRNNRVKQLNRRALSPWLHEALHAIANAPVRAFDGPIQPDIFSDIPTGACAEGYKTKAEKIYDICDHIPFGPFQVPIAGGTTPQTYTSRVRFVPKNYKSLRVIAMEPVYSQFLATQVSKGLERLFKSKKSIYHPYGRLDLRSQDRSRELAVAGSKDGSLATIDLSAASDSLSYPVVDACAPDCFSAWWANQSTQFDLDGKTYSLHIPLTMGSRVTMAMQTWVYWVISALACTLVANGDNVVLSSYLDKVAIYGDDIIVPTDCAETLIDLLTSCGLIVNTDKSFYDKDYHYREACGVEAYEGEIVSSCYWPRGVLDKHEQYVSLYNRVYERFGFLPTYHGFLRNNLKRDIPDSDDPDQFGLLVDQLSYHPATINQIPFDRDRVDSDFVRKLFVAKRCKLSTGARIDTKSIRVAAKRWGCDLTSVAEIFLYCQFLAEGPSYDDELMRLLGCSTQRRIDALLNRENASKIVIYYDWIVFF